MLFAVILMFFWSFSDSKNIIIKHRSSSGSVLLRNVLTQIKTASREECAQSCRNNAACSASALLGSDACVLYTSATCPCPDDAVSVSSELDSRYKIFEVGDGGSFDEVKAACNKEGMKLLDINSQHEQEMIEEFISSYKAKGLYLNSHPLLMHQETLTF